MSYRPGKLLTLVTESALEPLLKRDFEALGAEGYTIVDARGKGHRGVREANWGRSSTNIRVEVVCDAEMADRIAEHCRKNYVKNYGMIVYVSDVQVLDEHND